jgi:YesN/AraC family two-component response regulator
MNQDKCAYHSGNLFLLTPEDQHYFTIESTTDFFFLKFNNIFIKDIDFGTDNTRRLEYILQNANHQPGCQLKNISDRSFVAPIVEAIFQEYMVKDIYNKEMIRQLVTTLIVIVARNIAKFLPEQVSAATEEKAINILQYIQQHIYEPEKLRAEHLSMVFGISTTYLGRYFKKNMNETMQTYITKYKLKLIEHRLKFSDSRINEIVEEFGFSDVSHLNKYFKKQHGVSLKSYRSKER